MILSDHRPPWTYPALMLLSILTAVALTRRSQATLGLTRVQRIGIALGAFCGAMIGAKLPFVLADWEGLKSGRAWLDGGKTIVLGLVGGYFGVELAKWAMNVRIKTGDSFAAPVAAAVAIGRVACFVGGCCYGKETRLPWGVAFGDGLKRHPTQLYETIFHASMAFHLAWMRCRGLLRGQLIKLYIIAYGVYRFFSEFLRPEPQLFAGLTGYQWASLVIAPVFAGLWARDAHFLEKLSPCESGASPMTRNVM
jgi:phosphatidylglycerol---prolipoprotein diacylglyceryl transferase